MRTLALVLVGLLWALPAQAQLWSGILDPARAIDWSAKGVTGGIPTTRTQCGSTIAAYTGTAGTINTAITACGANQFVKLGAGTFNLSSGILISGKNDVTLRGNGPDSTFLVFTGADSCTGGWGAVICIRGPDISYYGPSPNFTTSWTAASYAKGATQITVASAANMSVGQWIVLDQLDDATNPGTDLFVCPTGGGVCTDEGGTNYGRTGRQQRQWVKITNIAGTLLTFTPGLYMPNWAAAKSPGAFWGTTNGMVHGVGIEDLSADALASGAGASHITFIFAYDSWAKNVRLIYAPNPRAYVTRAWSHHITVRDSYMFGSVSEGSGPLHYGFDATVAQDDLIENNIIQRRTSPIVSNGDVGTVYAYNFTINDQYPTSPTFLQAAQYSHESGNSMILHESNQTAGIKGDIVHGTSNLFTFFRNYSAGWETGKSTETMAVALYAFNRYWHFIGNVLGQVSVHTTYESSTNPTSPNGVIFTLGRAGNLVPFDSVVATTTMRWGNYDTVTGTTRFVASEVPSGIAKYSNPVPATQTLPNSFYLSSKPSFFGSIAWPAIGPDVSTGSGPGNHVIRIPARVCFEDIMGGTAADTTPRTFNASICYGAGGGDTTPPNAPQNLRVM